MTHGQATLDLGKSPATILAVRRDGVIGYANHGLQGEAPGEIVGRTVSDLLGERARPFLDAMERPTASAFEVGETGPGGTTRWWHVDASPSGEGAVFVLADITANKREEERLRRSEELLTDAQGVAHMGTWEWDITEPHAKWSAELYRIYGLRPDDYTPSYEGYLQMVHPDDRERVRRVTEAVFEKHEPYSHDERIFRPNGEMRWLHTWAVPILDDHGKLTRLVGVCQDITEQKKAESALRGQLMTRALARRLLHDLIQGAKIPEAVVRDMGRALARDHDGARDVHHHAATFEDMGFGQLTVLAVREGRYEFEGRDLLERREPSTLPTCFLTLGFLEGAVSAVTGGPAMGTEMRCQSMGHPECRFILRAADETDRSTPI